MVPRVKYDTNTYFGFLNHSLLNSASMVNKGQ